MTICPLSTVILFVLFSVIVVLMFRDRNNLKAKHEREREIWKERNRHARTIIGNLEQTTSSLAAKVKFFLTDATKEIAAMRDDRDIPDVIHEDKPRSVTNYIMRCTPDRSPIMDRIRPDILGNAEPMECNAIVYRHIRLAFELDLYVSDQFDERPWERFAAFILAADQFRKYLDATTAKKLFKESIRS